MTSHGTVAAKVRVAKVRHPERYCPKNGCLWNVERSGPCPKHGAWFTEPCKNGHFDCSWFDGGPCADQLGIGREDA